MSNKEKLYETECTIANFHDNKEIQKRYDTLDEDEDWVAINMNNIKRY